LDVVVVVVVEEEDPSGVVEVVVEEWMKVLQVKYAVIFISILLYITLTYY
jgi:hypothetical protein